MNDRSVNMPRTPEQYEEIRNEKKRMIMDVALELFANEGYHTTSISKIAEKANISKGLMYNYFESKEELVRVIMQTFSNEIMEMLDPDHDNEITMEEAIRFLDQFFEMLKQKREQMKLYFQLTVQPQVSNLLLEDQFGKEAMHNQKLLLEFFLKNTSDPVMSMITITSVLKGFALQYVFAPEMFPDEVMLQYKQYLINKFIDNK